MVSRLTGLPKVDAIDLALLRLLQHNSKRTRRELGAAVQLAGSTVCERIDKLERAGVILGYKASIAASLLSSAQDYFVNFRLTPMAATALRGFEQDLKTSSWIVSAARVGGLASYQVRVATRDGVGRLERMISSHALLICTFEASPVLDELVSYREPPVLASART